MNANENKKQGENKMSDTIADQNKIAMIKRVNEIVCNLITGNMENGSSYALAKTQAFNRLRKESPAVLEFWLNRFNK